MIQSDLLQLFAAVALGLAGVSGLVLVLARKGTRTLSSLHRARITVLFQLTSVALILGILPITMRANGFSDQQTLRISSLAMAVLLTLSMLLARRTYAQPRVEHAARIKTGGQLLFFGLMGGQVVMSAMAGVALWDTGGTAIYIVGLIVLLGLAFIQLLRFFGSEDLE